jgi:hypothetical protein
LNPDFNIMGLNTRRRNSISLQEIGSSLKSMAGISKKSKKSLMGDVDRHAELDVCKGEKDS